MTHLIDPLDKLWDALLSRDPALILSILSKLSPTDQTEIVVHLEKMAKEEGWLDVQRKSAQQALDVIARKSKGPKDEDSKLTE